MGTEVIRCHDDERQHSRDWWQSFGRKVPDATWEVRDGRRHCTWCGSLHPVDLLAALTDAPAGPAPETACGHGGHLDVPGWQECQRSMRALDASYVGLREHNWTEGWPHMFTVCLPGGGRSRFYCTHLRDLDERDFVAVAAIISRHTAIDFLRDDAGRLCFTTALTGATGP